MLLAQPARALCLELFDLPLVIAARSRFFTITGIGLLFLTMLAACTPEGEVDLQQVAGAAETAAAVSVALEQATIQAEELASLRATVESESEQPTPTVIPTVAPTSTLMPTATRVPVIIASPVVIQSTTVAPTALPSPTVLPPSVSVSTPVPTIVPTPTPEPTATQKPTATPIPIPTAVPTATLVPAVRIEFDTHLPGYAGDYYLLSTVRAIATGGNRILTAQIDWGDGSAVQSTVVQNSTGNIEIGHVYASVGFYRVSVSVSSETGDQATATFDLMIGHSPTGGNSTPGVAPTATAESGNQVVSEPKEFFTDSGGPQYSIVPVDDSNGHNYRIEGRNTNGIWERYRFYIGQTSSSGSKGRTLLLKTLPIPPSTNFTIQFSVDSLFTYSVDQVLTDDVLVSTPKNSIKVTARVRVQPNPNVDVMRDPLIFPHNNCRLNLNSNCGEVESTLMFVENNGGASKELCIFGLPIDSTGSVFANVDVWPHVPGVRCKTYSSGTIREESLACSPSSWTELRNASRCRWYLFDWYQ